MQNLNKNWLVAWKITWRIWQIFTRALESWDSKLALLWGTFIPSRKCMNLKFTGESCVMTMKKDRKLEKELTSSRLTCGFQQILTRAVENLKICTLMGCFWPKYIMLQLRKYRGVMFDCTQDGWKIWRKTNLFFQK